MLKVTDDLNSRQYAAGCLLTGNFTDRQPLAIEFSSRAAYKKWRNLLGKRLANSQRLCQHNSSTFRKKSVWLAMNPPKKPKIKPLVRKSMEIEKDILQLVGIIFSRGGVNWSTENLTTHLGTISQRLWQHPYDGNVEGFAVTLDYYLTGLPKLQNISTKDKQFLRYRLCKIAEVLGLRQDRSNPISRFRKRRTYKGK